MNKAKGFFIFLLFALSVTGKNLDSLYHCLEKNPKNDTNKVWTLFYLGVEHNQKGDLSASKKFMERAFVISDSLHYPKGLVRIYNGLAVIYTQHADYSKAIEMQMKSLKLSESLRNLHGQATAFLNLGNIYFYTGDFDLTIDCFRKGLRIYESENDIEGATLVRNNLGAIFVQKGDFDSAQTYFDQVIAHYTLTGATDQLAQVYLNMGAIHQYRKDFRKGLETTFKAHILHRKSGDKLNLSLSSLNIGEFYAQLKDYKNAAAYLDSSLAFAIETGGREHELRAYRGLASVFEETGNFGKALIYLERFRKLSDSLLNDESNRYITEMQTRYQAETQEKEIELLSKDKKIRDFAMRDHEANLKRQRIVIYSVISGFILLAVILYFVMKGYEQKKNINRALGEKNREIHLQKNLIEEKNNLINDSIDYAREIQSAVLPAPASLKSALGDHFILYRPKNVISGDIYWVKRTGQRTFFAVMDCTGHGVPGAFMSVMALNLLESIVSGKEDLPVNRILDELNVQLKEALAKGREKSVSKFGLDIGLCAISHMAETAQVEFSGAHHPLLVYRNGNLKEIRSDKIFPGMSSEKFSPHFISLEKGDMIYLFTDGATDQFGGEKREKLFAFRFRELIATSGSESTEKQKEILDKKLMEWKGNEEQLDDILVMGVRV